MMPISVVVPVYNAEKTLEKCVLSLMSMDRPEGGFELIFVDNNSTDNSVRILRKYSDKAIILFEKTQGASAARNAGISKANGEIIAFTDADCEVDKKWLRNLTGGLKEDTSIAATGGKILAKKPCNDIEKYGEIIHDHEKSINSLEPPYLITMNMAVRKDLLLKAGLFDESFIRGQDTDMSFKLGENGGVFKYESDAVVFHENEKTLKGLFREGFIHGFWKVKLAKKYRNTLYRARKRIHIKSYFGILRSLSAYATRAVLFKKDAPLFLCEFVFNTGKKAGMFCGSIKFRYLSL